MQTDQASHEDKISKLIKRHISNLYIGIHKMYMDLGSKINKNRLKLYKIVEKSMKKKSMVKERSDSIDTAMINSIYKTAPIEYRELLRKIVGLEALVYALALFCPITPEEAKEDISELERINEELDFETQIQNLSQKSKKKKGSKISSK